MVFPYKKEYVMDKNEKLEIANVISDFRTALETLDRYDHQQLEIPKAGDYAETKGAITYELAMDAIAVLKEKFRDSGIFGVEKDARIDISVRSMDEVLTAYKTQVDFFCKWQCTCINAWESMSSFHMNIPMVSATMEGCMENGKDVQCGGAKYNSTGNSCIAIGNVADALNVIDYVCFREKIATTRELYDAVMNNWEGCEELRQIINGRVPRFGNADPEADKYMNFTASTYADAINRATGPRGNRFSAGCYPVTANVLFGAMTWASPDGRKTGEPLSDGISPVQGMDKNGPVSTINSILNFDQTEYPNGTLCNMKFHPTALRGEDGTLKLKSVMQTFFNGGGMELQLNIISSDTLRDAQTHPENYKDLVVRVAGFSAYFVEVFKASQDDLIRRTEMGL